MSWWLCTPAAALTPAPASSQGIRRPPMAAAGGGAMTAATGFERSAPDDADANTADAGDRQRLTATPRWCFPRRKTAWTAVVARSDPQTRRAPLARTRARTPLHGCATPRAFAEQLDGLSFADSRVPVLSNTDPTLAPTAGSSAPAARPDDHWRALARNHANPGCTRASPPPWKWGLARC